MLCRLPEEYKEIVATYGTGSFDGFLWILTPFSRNKHLNLLDRLPVAREAYASMLPLPTEYQRFPFFPQPGGLLPFGVSDNGDTLYWQTGAGGQQWPIVVGAARDPAYEIFDEPLGAFLGNILSGRQIVKLFPSDFPSKKPGFSPFK